MYVFAASPVVGGKDECVYALMAFPVVGVEDECVYAFTAPPVLAGEDARAYVFTAFPKVGEEKECVCMWKRSWISPVLGKEGALMFTFAASLVVWGEDARVYMRSRAPPLWRDRTNVCTFV